MKIVYCIPGTYNSGGMERVLSLKVNALVQMGYTIHIVTTDQRGSKPFFPIDERVAHHDLGINYELNNGGSICRKLTDYPTKQRQHRKRLAALLGELKADIVVSMFGHEMGFLCNIKDGSKKVLEYHFSRLRRLQYGRKGVWRLADLWRTYLDGIRVKDYNRFVVLTEEDKALWGAMDNICVIPNPLSFEVDTLSPLTEKRVIAVGRYEYQKNFSSLIRIWSKVSPHFPDWELEIWGDGGERASLQEQIEALRLTSLHLRKPTSDMPTQYKRSSIYALTSHYEGLPMVLLEAQAMGLPIVAYTCPCGPRDIVTEGKDGYLIPLGDEELFASQLSHLMENEELRHSMGQQAYIASKRYTPAHIIEQWDKLFRSL